MDHDNGGLFIGLDEGTNLSGMLEYRMTGSESSIKELTF